MAKRGSNQAGQRPTSSLRVLFVELNGADTTIEEALRTVERMRRPVEVLPPLLKSIANENAPTAPADSTLFDTLDGIETNGVANEPDTAGDDAESGRRRRGDGPKVDRNAGITPAGDVDFYPSDKSSLKGFFDEKCPRTDMDKALVLCYYLQETLELPQFGPGHVLAGFREVDKAVPVDLKQTLRNMRGNTKRGKAWLNFTDIEKIQLSTGGINRVLHQLNTPDSQGDDGAK